MLTEIFWFIINIIKLIVIVYVLIKLNKFIKTKNLLINPKSYLMRADEYSKQGKYNMSIKTIDMMFDKYKEKGKSLSYIWIGEALLDKSRYLYCLNDYKEAVKNLDNYYSLLIENNVNEDVLLLLREKYASFIKECYEKANANELDKWKIILQLD